jgi:hypothetical protein
VGYSTSPVLKICHESSIYRRKRGSGPTSVVVELIDQGTENNQRRDGKDHVRDDRMLALESSVPTGVGFCVRRVLHTFRTSHGVRLAWPCEVWVAYSPCFSSYRSRMRRRIVDVHHVCSQLASGKVVHAARARDVMTEDSEIEQQRRLAPVAVQLVDRIRGLPALAREA